MPEPLTYQQYKNRKLDLMQTSYRLALNALAELEAMDADERDEDWEAYHTICFQDMRRLALELPLFVVMKTDQEESA